MMNSVVGTTGLRVVLERADEDRVTLVFAKEGCTSGEQPDQGGSGARIHVVESLAHVELHVSANAGSFGFDLGGSGCSV